MSSLLLPLRHDPLVTTGQLGPAAACNDLQLSYYAAQRYAVDQAIAELKARRRPTPRARAWSGLRTLLARRVAS